MALSKAAYSLFGSYLEQLFNHPVRTKSITSSVLAASANYTAQRISGDKEINQKSLVAYGLFGLVFGGSLPHYFYQITEQMFADAKFKRFLQFMSERLVYAPVYQAISLYFLSIFEMNSHDVAVANLKKLYWPVLKANWQYLSLPIFINMTYVPPMLRSLFVSIVMFVWVVYIAGRRRRLAEKMARDAAAAAKKQ